MTRQVIPHDVRGTGSERALLLHTWWYPNAQLEVLPDTGHYAPEESPEAVAAAIERYLGR
ncbi:hypothetical protein ABZZ04_10155 [Streptomyces sp. NPDC006435]|uniref:alpha/beta fold hydrolase n=1 Tax=Streptomyces sp. NPDC006435 TaxID=3154300 RepID=UPI00339EFC68